MLFVRSNFACLVLSVSSSSWCLGRASVCDCGIPWTFFLPFFTSCVVMLFGNLQQLPILLSVLLAVIKSGIGTQGEVG